MLGIYLLGIALVLIVAKVYIFNKKRDSDKKGLLILTFIFLVILMGCRNAQQNYGSDINNYYRTYERAINSTFSEFLQGSSMERGYLYLNWVLARIIKWPQFILFFQAAFCCGITLRYIYKHSTDVVVSILGFLSLGLFQFYLTGFRQSIAIVICLLAFEMAENRKMVGFMVCVIAAMSIHQTAIVFLLVYLVANVRVSRLSILLDVGFIVFVSRFIPGVIEFGNRFFDKDYEGTFVGNSTGGLINVVIGLFIIFVMMYQIRRVSVKTTSISDTRRCLENEYYYPNYKMFHILTLGIGIYVMRYQALVLERISYYFTPTMFILLPEVIRNGFVNKDSRLLRFLVILGMLFLTYWRLKGSDYAAFWN